MTSARMKPLARSVWILPAASTAFAAALEVPAAHLGLAGREERDDADRVVSLANDPIAAQFAHAQVGHERRALVGLELSKLELELGVDRQCLGCQCPERVRDVLALERVHEGHLGLVGQEPERSERLLVVGRELERGDRLAFLEGRLHDLDDFELLECLLAVGPSLLDAGFQPLGAAGDDAQVGEEQFVAKRRQLGRRVSSGESVQDDQAGRPPRGSGRGAGGCRRASPTSRPGVSRNSTVAGVTFLGLWSAAR